MIKKIGNLEKNDDFSRHFRLGKIDSLLAKKSAIKKTSRNFGTYIVIWRYFDLYLQYSRETY